MDIDICLFGTFDRTFPRNSLLVDGLGKAGARLSWCHVPAWERFPGGKRHGSFFRPWNLLRVLSVLTAAYARLFLRLARTESLDLYLVGYPGYFDVAALRLFLFLLRRRKPVALILLITLYDTICLDRKLFREGGLGCRAVRLIDRMTLSSADMVLTDTEAYREFLLDIYGTDKGKTRALYIGADSGVFVPAEGGDRGKEWFEVLFFGMFIPLHGLETMVRAAKLLEHRKDIHFTFFGTGQLREEIEELAEEVGLAGDTTSFPGWIPQDRIPGEIARSDLCLGIFGESVKAGMVIPNKAFQVIAMERPFITRRSPAIEELFTHGENAWLVPAGDPRALAGAIETLEGDRALCRSLARRGRKTYLDQCSQEAIGRRLLGQLQELTRGPEADTVS